MTSVIGFSSIGQFIDGTQVDKIGCLVDTNFTIACLHHMHTFYSDANDCYRILAEKSFPMFSTHTIRSEFLDVHRKYVLTRKLVELYNEEGKWRGRVKKDLKEFLEPYVENIRKSKESFYLLGDKTLKDIKMEFFPRNESGKVGWIDFCEHFLSQDMESFWNNISGSFGLNYINLRDEEAKEESSFIKDKMSWKEMVSIVGSTGVGTSDAMIVNVLNCSKFPLMITTDLDVAYSIAGCRMSKTVAIPDNMLKKHSKLFKKLTKIK